MKTDACGAEASSNRRLLIQFGFVLSKSSWGWNQHEQAPGHNLKAEEFRRNALLTTKVIGAAAALG
jgi:hypothetical protein